MTDPVVLGPGEGESVTARGSAIRFKATAATIEGRVRSGSARRRRVAVSPRRTLTTVTSSSMYWRDKPPCRPATHRAGRAGRVHPGSSTGPAYFGQRWPSRGAPTDPARPCRRRLLPRPGGPVGRAGPPLRATPSGRSCAATASRRSPPRPLGAPWSLFMLRPASQTGPPRNLTVVSLRHVPETEPEPRIITARTSSRHPGSTARAAGLLTHVMWARGPRAESSSDPRCPAPPSPGA